MKGQKPMNDKLKQIQAARLQLKREKQFEEDCLSEDTLPWGIIETALEVLEAACEDFSPKILASLEQENFVMRQIGRVFNFHPDDKSSALEIMRRVVDRNTRTRADKLVQKFMEG